MILQYEKSKHQNYQPGVQNRGEKVDYDSITIDDQPRNDDIEMSSENYWHRSTIFSISPPWTSNTEKTTRIEDQFVIEFEVMDSNSDFEKNCVTEPGILFTTAQEMGREILSFGDSRNGTVHR
ncbi:hypothetical protein AYI69_g2517 [Smittium culicis]|uniref:Uncharacterized protein n=1 Tax=Smittium culicis TaxID=133412 RepID=A0A1R1YM78_9FUNG|nr:hypothetical protein AYI69_g2517 [Smittium culicis]